MSHQAQTWVAEHCPYELGPARAVMTVLANYADAQTATAWPGLERIGIEGGISRRSVFEALRLMRSDGTVIRRGWQSRERERKRPAAAWELVTDVSKWTLCAASIASNARLQARRARAWQRRTGMEMRPEAAETKVHPVHLSPEIKVRPAHLSEGLKVRLEARKGAPGALSGGTHQSYDPYMNQSSNDEGKGDRSGETDEAAIRAGGLELIRATIARMDKKVGRGV